MDKENYINIFDIGSSKIRFSVFDKNLNSIFSDNIYKEKDVDIIDYSNKINKIIKKAEKKIFNHIEDVVIATDTKKLITIDISIKEKFDNEMQLNKIYENILKEIKHLINYNYPKYEIIHLIVTKAIIDKNEYLEIPKKNIGVKNISVDFKIICFPKKLIENLNLNFTKCNLEIKNIFCTSYLKSEICLKKFNSEDISFLEIGLERSSLIIYKNRKISSINVIPIGGLSITKDIAKIFNIEFDDAEKIKKLFNKSGSEFSYDQNLTESNLPIVEIIKKNISIDLLKKVILYRVQEIIDLSFKPTTINSVNQKLKNFDLYLLGEGSKLLNNNSFHINDKFGFNSINFYDQSDVDICNNVLLYHLNNFKNPKNLLKTKGFFEKFFNFFSK